MMQIFYKYVFLKLNSKEMNMPLPIIALAAAKATAEVSIWLYITWTGEGLILIGLTGAGGYFAYQSYKENNKTQEKALDEVEEKNSSESSKSIEIKSEDILTSSRESVAVVKENETLALEKLTNTSVVLETSVEDMEEKSQSVEKNTDKLLDLIAHNQANLEKHRTAQSHQPAEDLSQDNEELKEEIKRLRREIKLKDAMLISLSEHIKHMTEDSLHRPGSR